MAVNSVGPTRLFGLASGMDTEALVKSLMRLEQMKLNRDLRAKITLQWRQEALNSVDADLKNFRNTFLTTLGDAGMLKTNTYTAFKVETSGAKKDAISVSANSEAYAGKLVLNKITQLAESAQAESLNQVSANGTQLAEGNYAKLGELQFAKKLFIDPSNGRDIDEISFSINGETFNFNKNTTLQEMLTTVSNSNAGVTMSYSRLSDGFIIKTKETGLYKEDGSENVLNITNITGNAFGANSAFAIESSDLAGVRTGNNAVAYINGIRVERTTNTFRIDGIQYTLNYVTGIESSHEKNTGRLDVADPLNDPASEVSITLTKDIDSAYDKIKAFIDGYNTVVKKLYGLINEKKDSKYYALTDDEKEGMTEKQIEQWESFAKSGLLRSDRDIHKLLDEMRSAFYSKVAGTNLSPQDIGLRTGDYYTSGKGEIIIDEVALRAALEKDSDTVMRVMMGGPDAENYAERGLLYRLNDAVNDYTQRTKYITIDSLERNLFSINNRIEQMEKKMRKIEEKYYLQFAAMEDAMAKMNSQSNWLDSVMAGLFKQS
ncbi:MAG: flagellar filament capping protein FliD [Firmicutes bacterium]|nr:flagellar filament capping protein FliD [Bacillota bacterium]